MTGEQTVPAAAQPGGLFDTRRRLLLAAEKLFGIHGIEGVSARQIRLEAGQLNSNAVQYHFQNKEDLVFSVMKSRVSELEAIRRPMLEKIIAEGRSADQLALLKVILLPHLSLRCEDGHYHYARFMSEYLTRYRAKAIGHPIEDQTDAPVLFNAVKLLRSTLFMFDREIALMRVTAATLLFLNALVQFDSGLTYENLSLDIDTVAAESLSMALAVLNAPPSEALRDRYTKR